MKNLIKNIITKRPILVLISIFLVCAGAPSQVGQAEEHSLEDQIFQITQQMHPSDTAETWTGLDGDHSKTVAAIVALYEKTDSTQIRNRLLSGLSRFSDQSKAVEFLKSQAGRTSDSALRRTAIQAIGASQGAKESDFLAGFLTESDPQLRLAAAEALQRTKDPHALEIVEKYKSEEKASWIVAKLKGEVPRVKPNFASSAKPADAASSGAVQASPSPLSTLGLVPLPGQPLPDDAPSPEFIGRWRGFWVAPQGLVMKSEPSVVRIQVSSTNPKELVAEWVRKSAQKMKTISIFGIQGKGYKIRGEWAEAGSDRKITFEAELTPSLKVLQLRAPGIGGVLQLKRE